MQYTHSLIHELPGTQFIPERWALRGALVGFLSHAKGSSRILRLLSTKEKPVGYNALMRELRLGKKRRFDNYDLPASAIRAALRITQAAGLVRMTRHGFSITELGREIQRRIHHEPPRPRELLANELSPATRNAIPMKTRNIIITAPDHARLTALIASGIISQRERGEANALAGELERAEIVAPDAVPPDVITMNSRAELLDLDTGARMEFTLVFPEEAELADGKISVLAPVGTGMLGYRVGDTFERRAPFGVRRLKVIAVTFQPEAALATAACAEV